MLSIVDNIVLALSVYCIKCLFYFYAQWVVVVVEVKPSLLSGDSERFLLKEITQVILRNSLNCLLLVIIYTLRVYLTDEH